MSIAIKPKSRVCSEAQRSAGGQVWSWLKTLPWMVLGVRLRTGLYSDAIVTTTRRHDTMSASQSTASQDCAAWVGSIRSAKKGTLGRFAVCAPMAGIGQALAIPASGAAQKI